jgi:Fe-S oxidoreductase
LRFAVSGQLGAEGLASDAVREALELCVSCKGCKRECPTGVDMAKLKIEALAAYRSRYGLSLRDRLFAYLPRYAPLASRVRWLAGLRDRVPGAAALVERMLRISARRELPRWRRGYVQAAHGADKTFTPPAGKEVLLFVDTFTNYFASENAVAARKVLEAAGYRVRLNAVTGERPLCCGRTFLAAGLVDEARAEARRTIGALASLVRRGVAVVGLEPSCLLGMRDEFLDYRLGEDASLVARQALLFEEFLVRERKAGRLALELRSAGVGEALLHAHCHQKAFAAVAPIEEVLGWIPGLAARTIEASCCGMAGAFGYEAAHYDVSMRMAEATLLPAVRAAPASAWIVADGFSCRHQIRDGSGREALHVARVLERALPAA